MSAALLAVAVLATTAACNDSSSGDGAGATTATQREDAAATLTKDNFADEIRAAQAAARTAHVEATVESQGQSLRLAGDVDGLDTPQTPAFDFTADAGSQKLQMIVVDQVLYVTGEGLTGSGGKKWVKIDLKDSTNPLGQIFEAANPGNFAAYLEGVTTFEDKGSDTVDGVQTHHYDVTVDTATMLKSNPVFKGRDVSQLGLPEAITSEVYVDADNRPIEIKVDLAAAGAFEAHVSDYGKQVDVTAPPSDQVGTLDLGGN
jgi:hypothetical protein